MKKAKKIKSDAPLISVIMPAYNAEPYIGQAIESILNQTYKNLELIIIDDCSTDRSGAIADHYATKDNRVMVIHGKEKLYEVGGRNLGLEKSSGDYVAWQDADDISLPARLEKQYQYIIKNQHVDVVGSYIKFIGNNNTKEYEDYFKRILTMPDVNSHGLKLVTMPPTYLFKKNILNKLTKPYFRPITLGLDTDFQFRLMEKNIRIFNMPDILYHYRLHDNQLTSRKFDLSISLLFIRYIAICRRTFNFDPLNIILKKYKKIDGNDIIPAFIKFLINFTPSKNKIKFIILTMQYFFYALLIHCYASWPWLRKPWRAFKKIILRKQ